MLTNSSEPTTQSPVYQKVIGVLIWLAFAVAGMVALYLLSFLAGVAECPLWVKSRLMQCSSACPLYPQ